MPHDNSAGNVVARKQSPFEIELAEYEPQLVAALPGHISVDRFKRTVITAINQAPDLMNAERRSLFTACVRAAQDGLLPDGREAALVIFNTKNKKTNEWRKLVQYMPMVQGIIKRMRNSGELAAIYAHVVFAKDEFTYQLGDDPKIVHKPAMLDRGEPIGVYAVAKLTNGEVQREIMSVAEVEKVRAVSRAKDDGPWRDWWEEMARKTVIRRLSKRLPNSSDIDEMMRREDAQYFSGGTHGETHVAVARPTRQSYGATIDAEPSRPVEEERAEDDADLYPIINSDGVETLIAEADTAAAALRELIHEADKERGVQGIAAVWQDNAVLLDLLRERGHSEIASELTAYYEELAEPIADVADAEGILR